MPNITVHRHGDRWAVAEPGADSPVKEFPSREEAEVVARQMAAGGVVDVVDHDPTGLDAATDADAGEPIGDDADRVHAGDAAERTRSNQPGL